MRGVHSGVARAGAREWRIVFAASFGMLFSYGPIVTFTFGIFVSPLTREFGWTRSELALGLSLANVCFALTQPLFGALLDRFGARRVIVPSVLVFGMSLLSFCFLTGRIWQFYLAYLVMGACAGGSGSISYYHVV
jgi:MFS family permease